MSSYAVFLRGVNVAGITIKMADLKAALTSRPFSDVTTLLASGNVVLTRELSDETLPGLLWPLFGALISNLVHVIDVVDYVATSRPVRT